MDITTTGDNEKNASLVLAQRRTWRRIFWWMIMPGLLPPLSLVIFEVPALILDELSLPRPSYSRSFPFEFSIIVFFVAVWNASPYIVLGLLGKDWLGMKSTEPLDPATFYERKVAFIGAALLACGLGFLIYYLAFFSHYNQGGPLLLIFAPIGIFMVAGLGLFAGWVIGRGSQTYR